MLNLQGKVLIGVRAAMTFTKDDAARFALLDHGFLALGLPAGMRV